DACCIEVLNSNSPTTPPTASIETTIRKGTGLVRRRLRLGTTVRRARSRAAPARRGTRARRAGAVLLISGCSLAGGGSGAFDGAQPDRGGARVGGDLGVVRALGAAGDQPEGRLAVLRHDGQVRRHVCRGHGGKRLLD